ncbi:MAG: 3'-5' exonuclease [Clostridia bacterium]|nr:3'-5' exonuclease [Clostridia bacterium]
MKIDREYRGKSLYLLPEDYTVVDIETSGLSPSVAEIIEISALKCRDRVPIATFSTLVRPDYPVDWFITNLTGITNRMLSDAPKIDDVLDDFYDFLGRDLIIGHNVSFDVNFLYDNFLRRKAWYFRNDFVDVLRLSRKALPTLSSHKQTAIAEYFGLDCTGSHRALRDCEICNENYLRIREILLRAEG